MEACWNGDFEGAKKLIEQGAEINEKNENGTTPLMYAKTFTFRTGDISIMKLLLANGADPNIQDNAGKTAADYTIERSKLIIKTINNFSQKQSK